VYAFDFDPQRLLFVCRLSRGGDADQDFATHLAELKKAAMVAAATDQKLATAVHLQFGHPIPGAQWRAKVGELMSDPSLHITIAVISKNPVVRGVLTAVSWVAGDKFDYKMVPHPKGAGEFLSERTGREIPELAPLFESLGAAEKDSIEEAAPRH
jgi:hypothetical protein